MQQAAFASHTSRVLPDAGFAWGRRFTAAILGIGQPLFRRTRSLTSRFHWTWDEMPDSTRIEASDDLLHFQSALSDPGARDALRQELKRGRGTERLEFLLAFRGFEEARNPLQRFQQFSHIVHRFVIDCGDRRVILSESCRGQLLLEFSRWSDAGRVPMDAPLGALESAAAEVNLDVVAASHEPFLNR